MADCDCFCHKEPPHFGPPKDGKKPEGKEHHGPPGGHGPGHHGPPGVHGPHGHGPHGFPALKCEKCGAEIKFKKPEGEPPKEMPKEPPKIKCDSCGYENTLKPPMPPFVKDGKCEKCGCEWKPPQPPK